VAAELAEKLLRASLDATTPEEAARMRRVAGLIENPSAKEFTLRLTDAIGRSQDPDRVAHLWRRLRQEVKDSAGFSLSDRILLQLGTWGSHLLPKPVIDAVRKRLRDESRSVILPAEDDLLTEFLAERRAAGARVNLNQLGEAVLGEEEATQRLEAIITLLGRDDVDYVSVKISAIFSQIHLVAWEETLTAIKDRLRRLFRAAMDGGAFVNLDMEEYRDLHLTERAFRELLDEPEFQSFAAGIVLQAYLPDSFAVQEELTHWAQERVERGGAPIKLRLVKGANLAMEQVEAEMHGWNPAPHRSKHETDASFKRMLEYGCDPRHLAAVRLGVASHNLFDLALALVLRERSGVADRVEIEMLEGMAPPQSRVVQDAADGLLTYAPIVHQQDYGSALAYLIRRLDENTAPGNFLASLFSLRPGSPAWEEEKKRFFEAWQARHTVTTQSFRASLPAHPSEKFSNEPDTDWTQPGNRARLAAAKACASEPPRADLAAVEEALRRAEAGRAEWEATPESTRAELLRACARKMAEERFETIALMRDEAKKAVTEADAEVSEAIDFARFYADTGGVPPQTDSHPLGTVVVTPPWNFPYAIPCGGVLAALMAGNTVLLKPAPETVRLGWWLACQLWAAGVPREVLQFVACADGDVGCRLITDERTSAVILTGAYETARRFQEWRPSLRLFAETSGKNSLIVSALSDRELAVKDLVRSAFGHAGQKCSAASLGILEAEVYDDPVFRRQLRDAAASLPVGPASDPRSVVTPLVQAPTEKLLRALTTLEPGESWLLEPKQVSAVDPCLWTPGIKLGVRRGTWFHQTECFGPVLGLMRAHDLGHAIELQNEVAYGLTAGLHSLDPDEITYWRERVQAGNLYINRGITGAIVRRQPFGGWKRSSIGPGAKAGGPNYVNLFRVLTDRSKRSHDEALTSYQKSWDTHFSIGHDPSGLRCERNLFRYRPMRGVLLRLPAPDEGRLVLARLAAQIAGVPIFVSRTTQESSETLAARLPELRSSIECVRTLDGPPDEVFLRAIADCELNWIDAPLSTHGRIELTRWVREQSVSETLHRYGNVLRKRD
jgi:RHH-type proline utilization regulon transcriptional repressor/proline dehydrogenase/delta 1-pyrroline-5-carboxylate dehydrogenase